LSPAGLLASLGARSDHSTVMGKTVRGGGCGARLSAGFVEMERGPQKPRFANGLLDNSPSLKRRRLLMFFDLPGRPDLDGRLVNARGRYAAVIFRGRHLDRLNRFAFKPARRHPGRLYRSDQVGGPKRGKTRVWRRKTLLPLRMDGNSGGVGFGQTKH